jgi:membrane protease YdiL (CAAX protease family)
LSGPPPLPLPDTGSSLASPNWKRLLALLALALSLVLWTEGLLGSLERPSVLDALGVRQMEVTALAAEGLPAPWQAVLVGDDPRGALRLELDRQIKASGQGANAVQSLEMALLDSATATDPPRTLTASVTGLLDQVDGARQPLLKALLRGQPVAAGERAQLLAPWGQEPMLEQLTCERLGGPLSSCPAQRQHRHLLVQLLGISVLPVVLMIVGGLLLLRQLWRFYRGSLPPPPPLQGPSLSAVDVTLLIAGGFVIVGEVLLPVLLQSPAQALLQKITLAPATSQGLQVLFQYLVLMLAPLLILHLLLRGRQAPEGGWLQWRWRPLFEALTQAIGALLMVMPLVALASWLLSLVWSEPGGSNPLLELVFHSGDRVALLCLGFTATVLAPLFEETLFRGVLLPVLGQRLGGLGAVLASAAVFALAHLSLGELVPLFVLGVGLGLLRWRTGRLAPGVFMHGFWNALTFINLISLAG